MHIPLFILFSSLLVSAALTSYSYTYNSPFLPFARFLHPFVGGRLGAQHIYAGWVGTWVTDPPDYPYIGVPPYRI